MSSDAILLSIPHLAGNEWKYIKECLDTNWVSYVGPFVDRFERELAVKAGTKYAVATSSGTAALHTALILAGVNLNDEVVMPGLTFVAPANAVRYCGAWPTFTDICADDWQWDVEQVASFLSQGCVVREGKLINKQTGRRIAALLPVHLLGGMCDVDAIAELASKYQLPVIEDAAECFGATYKGRSIATHCHAYRGPVRLVITSFNGNKIITTGGGGAIFTDDIHYAQRAKHLTTTAKAVHKFDFYHDEIGYNYRLTNLAAAMGVAQLEQLDKFVNIKRTIANRYAAMLATIPQVMQHPEPAECQSTFWMYSVMLSASARPDVNKLNADGIMSRLLWVPLNLLPMFNNKCFSLNLTNCNRLHDTILSLPCSVGLTDNDQIRVARKLLEHTKL